MNKTNDEFCNKKKESCIKTKEFCIQNEELCIQNYEFCSETAETAVAAVAAGTAPPPQPTEWKVLISYEEYTDVRTRALSEQSINLGMYFKMMIRLSTSACISK